jgi:hypothetical protein
MVFDSSSSSNREQTAFAGLLVAITVLAGAFSVAQMFYILHRNNNQSSNNPNTLQAHALELPQSPRKLQDTQATFQLPTYNGITH